jgi:broad specificity phosphatase PhoE
MTKIILTRHGHVDGIKPERFRGRADLALTAHGEAEARAVARRIAAGWQPNKVYTSPMARCVATGAAIAAACSIEAASLDELNDLDYGAWQLRTHDEVRRTDADLFAAWFATPQLVRFPEGESLQDLAARGANVLRFVLNEHGDDTVVLVGHDSVNRALLMQFLDQPLSAYWRIVQAPCCVNEIDVLGANVRVLRINETLHLEGVDAT